ncbi:LysR family transcriptional regulator [Streptomyces poonensis]|uniref:LysR family transcriptional regulator n=1 Tax=Streptomyces poonensis TaxID=68255 RepID=A0A918Q5A4_9ACTN|nr:LysR family transcriptional regulator [Streptomyces poonensis]GGZ32528.1 LysR family transcriptional regulator [Streptomyces poonensis]GLJ92839.1 LysR family transcriptional regulator [Streptomyces poonensis]
MLLRQLEYLTALARERHFARAAEACHVSQPSLSAGIRTLERELKVMIVRRGRRFEGFTPEGERVVMWARRILAERDALRDDIAAMDGGLTGVLRIGAIPTALTAAQLLTMPFFDRHPQVRISLESLSSREMVHRLAEYDLDVGLSYVDGEPLGSVRTVPLYRERHLLLTPGDGELAHRSRAGWADVARLPLCLLSPQMQNRRILDRCFADAGVGAVHASLETDTVSALYAHLGTGRWSSVIAHAWLGLFGVPAGMRLVPMERPARSYHVGLVLADRDPALSLVRALVDVAHQVDVAGELDGVLRACLRRQGPLREATDGG